MMERYLCKLVVEQDLHGNFLVKFSWFLVSFFFWPVGLSKLCSPG